MFSSGWVRAPRGSDLWGMSVGRSSHVAGGPGGGTSLFVPSGVSGMQEQHGIRHSCGREREDEDVEECIKCRRSEADQIPHRQRHSSHLSPVSRHHGGGRRARRESQATLLGHLRPTSKWRRPRRPSVRSAEGLWEPPWGARPLGVVGGNSRSVTVSNSFVVVSPSDATLPRSLDFANTIRNRDCYVRAATGT